MNIYIVYLITNLLNGKYYVGWTKHTLKERWDYHCWCAEQGEQWHISCAIRKWKRESFVQEVLMVVSTVQEVKTLEKLWIRVLRSYDPEVGYNMTYGGDGWADWNLLSDEKKKEIITRRIAGLIARGKNPTQKMKDRPAKISASHKLNGVRPLRNPKPKGSSDVDLFGEERAKEISERLANAVRGTKRGIWITNGISNCLLKEGPMPEGFRKGKTQKQYKSRGPDSYETRIAKSNAQKLRWANT